MNSFSGAKHFFIHFLQLSYLGSFYVIHSCQWVFCWSQMTCVSGSLFVMCFQSTLFDSESAPNQSFFTDTILLFQIKSWNLFIFYWINSFRSVSIAAEKHFTWTSLILCNLFALFSILLNWTMKQLLSICCDLFSSADSISARLKCLSVKMLTVGDCFIWRNE